jgi:hypothetical protein
MKFSDKTFSCILDKGTFDALSPPPDSFKNKQRNKTEIDDNNDGENCLEEKVKVDLMMEEIARVLKPGGRFICISLLQPHVADRILSYFFNLGWMIRVVRCLDAEEKTAQKNGDDNSSVVFPVFMIICTKLNLPAGANPVIYFLNLIF